MGYCRDSHVAPVPDVRALLAMTFVIAPGGRVILNRKAVKDPNRKRYKGNYAAVRIWILRRIAPQNDVNVGALFGGGIYGLFAEIVRRAAPQNDAVGQQIT